MGQVCSGAGMNKHVCVPRDPADKELDPLEMRETKIADFDTFFESAAAPLNELVEIHNAIAQSEENLKAAAAALQGETQVRLTVQRTGNVSLVLWCFDKKDRVHVLTAEERDEKLDFTPELREAYEASEHAITDLNTALEKPPTDSPLCEFAEKRGRLLVTKRGALDMLVRDVNVAVFSLRKHLMLRAHVTSLGEAAKILLKELAKEKDLSELTVETDEEGTIKLMNGEEELDLRKLDNLRPPVAQLRDALVELLENVQTAVESVPELAESCTELGEEAKEFPAKIPEAVSESGLSMTEIPKAASATSRNIKALKNGPKIAKATTVLIQYAGRELVEAAGIPHGG